MKSFLTTVLFVSLGAAPLSADVIYNFSVDTSSLDGVSGNLDFQLNPGNPGASAVTAVIASFTTDGSYDPGTIVLTGDASGALGSSSIILDNGTFYNDAYQPILLGSFLDFTATFSGPGIDTPGNPGTQFGFSIYNAAGDTAFLTVAPDGTIAGITVDSLNGIQPYTNPATVGGASDATVTATPEPVSFMMSAAGLAGMFVVRRRLTN